MAEAYCLRGLSPQASGQAAGQGSARPVLGGAQRYGSIHVHTAASCVLMGCTCFLWRLPHRVEIVSPETPLRDSPLDRPLAPSKRHLPSVRSYPQAAFHCFWNRGSAPWHGVTLPPGENSLGPVLSPLWWGRATLSPSPGSPGARTHLPTCSPYRPRIWWQQDLHGSVKSG